LLECHPVGGRLYLSRSVQTIGDTQWEIQSCQKVDPKSQKGPGKKEMTKVVPLSDAIATYVNDGDVVYAAGFTHLIPFAAGHEIIRQGKKDLTLARATPDLIYDQLVAAGCARKVIFSYMGNPGVGSLRIVRSAIEQGKLEWEEYSHFGMITRLQAGASGLPFLPMNQTGATDLERANPNIRRIPDPFGGKDVIVVPALNPDVAIVHVQRADADGNAHLWGIIGEQKEAAFAAKKVILTAEEIVDEAVIRSDPNRTMIPGIVVSAVCHVPFACHPSYAQGYYDRDNEFYLAWDKVSESAEATKQYLTEWVYGVKDRTEYWEKLGVETHKRLEVPQQMSQPINYGKY
jgi:glutaconate CoA-transferase, subunit A